MPDLQTDYRRVVAEARASTLRLTRRSLAELELLYANLLAKLIEEATAASGEQSTGNGAAERLTRRSRAVRAALLRVAARIEALEADARDAARIMGDGHSRAVALAVADHRPGFAVRTSFETVPERAVEALLRRRQVARALGLDSYSALFRSVAQGATEGVLEELDGVLLRGVGRGADSRAVARQIAEALTEGEPALRRAVERLAPSLRRAGAALSARGEAIVQAEDLQEARQLLVRARRIARTEVLDAARVADAEAAHLSPVVAGLRWTLSSSHPVTGCACDVYARTDLYGMGEGVFPTNAYPSAPHPNCGCYSRAVTRRPDEWDRPKPAASAPAVLERYPFERRPGGLPYTDAHKQRIRESANAQLAAALDVSAETPVPTGPPA